jgi:4-amino-4-deoxy-L-arabinose transferase-like glycosyltransferase
MSQVSHGGGIAWRAPRGWAAAAIVFVITLAAYSFDLGNAPLARTEGHRALTAHEMVQTGQWLIPRLYDRVYLIKPPLAYWIIGLFEKLVGTYNEWVWRLPSVLASAALGAGICLFSDAWFGSPAGIVAGLAHLALVAVWAQNRSADVDAMNSAAAVMATCGLVHLSLQSNRRRWVSCAGTAAAIGATAMIKGPAGFTIILGGLIGPAIFTRRWSILRRWEPWAALAIGLMCLGAYAGAAYLRLKADHTPLDLSGFEEVAYQTKYGEGGRHFIYTVLLPPTLLLYAMPLSLVIPLALMRPLWNSPDERFRLCVRAIVGALAVALATALVAEVNNPRYCYVILPMLCPLVGAAAVAMPRQTAGLAVISAIGLAVMAAVLAVICRIDHLGQFPLAAGAAAAAIGGAIVALKRPVACVAVMLLAMVPFAIFNNQQSVEHSACGAGRVLAGIVPPDSVVLTGITTMDHPEVFYYGKVTPNSMLINRDQPPQPDHWLILENDENEYWRSRLGNQLTRWTALWPDKQMNAVWYSVNGSSPP